MFVTNIKSNIVSKLILFCKTNETWYNNNGNGNLFILYLLKKQTACVKHQKQHCQQINFVF